MRLISSALIMVSGLVPSTVPRHRHHRRHRPMHSALASWYDDSGQTASGRHYPYGFASLMFGSDWGKRILFCYRRCVIGILDDHGPYVSGRSFDLNSALHSATGCTDLCVVKWRVM